MKARDNQRFPDPHPALRAAFPGQGKENRQST